MAEWLRNGLQNRVLRFNSGRGLQLFQSTKNTIFDLLVAARWLTCSDKAHGPWTRARLKRSRQFSDAGTKYETEFPEREAPFILDICAMQQSIAAMRQLSVIIMVYQHISAVQTLLQPLGCRFIET